MQRTLALIALPLLLLIGCAGQPGLSSRDVQVDADYGGGAVGKILVLALMPDELHDSRVIVERGFTHAMQDAGIDVLAGYTRFDSIDALVAAPDTFQPQLAPMGVDAVLFLDPVKLDLSYDPTAYDNRRTVYRALGMEYSESAAFWGKVAHQASAAKVVMNAGLWQPGGDKDLWNATYDINAPDNQDVGNAREYTAGFADSVIADLQAQGLVK